MYCQSSVELFGGSSHCMHETEKHAVETGYLRGICVMRFNWLWQAWGGLQVHTAGNTLIVCRCAGEHARAAATVIDMHLSFKF